MYFECATAADLLCTRRWRGIGLCRPSVAFCGSRPSEAVPRGIRSFCWLVGSDGGAGMSCPFRRMSAEREWIRGAVIQHTWQSAVGRGASSRLRRSVRRCAWSRRKSDTASMIQAARQRRARAEVRVWSNDAAVGSKAAAEWRGGGWRGSRSCGFNCDRFY